MDYNKNCTIKIWYWNYRLEDTKGGQYHRDNKRINLEILQDGERQALIDYPIPEFVNGHRMVDKFLNDKIAVLHILPHINYIQGFKADDLKYDLVNLIQGESDMRFKE